MPRSTLWTPRFTSRSFFRECSACFPASSRPRSRRRVACCWRITGLNSSLRGAWRRGNPQGLLRFTRNDGGSMRHFAVVGSGPAGFYTAEALEKAYGDAARIDILDRYPVPYGLIRFGVAPDHQSLKAVSKRYDKVAESAGVDFIGNVAVGRDVSIAELLDLYDAVILATGAPHDRKLGIPGEDLPGVVGSGEFVGWYNGHPEFAGLDPFLNGTHTAVVGNGNVALDCARLLSKPSDAFAGSAIIG